MEAINLLITLTGRQDLIMARELNALTPEAQDALNKVAEESPNTKPFSQTPGIDIIFGGRELCRA